jgi:hypothetical protein
MTNTVLTPERRGQLIDLGNGKWRKQILPLGSINYKGSKITFDRNYLSELVKSFKNRACGPVPFQVADRDNKHTNDPFRRHGTVQDLEIDDDGLYAIVDLDENGEKLVKEYPDLGVSARIYESYERSDGQFFPAALQHVLGTLDPHVTGMRPWQAVALSNDFSGRVIDLSDSEFDTGKEEGKPVATKTGLKDILAKLKKSGDEAELTDDELDQLLEITDAIKSEDAEKPDEGADDKADKTKTKPITDESELTDEELDALIAEAETEAGLTDSAEDEETEQEEEGDPVKSDPKLIAASNENRTAIELANAKIEQQNIELTAVRKKMHAQEFETEVRTFAQQYGIPPRITELARDLLEGDGHVIQLSNGDEIDAGAVMRKVLVELGSTIKALDLGNLVGLSEDKEDNDEARQREAAESDTRNWVESIKSNYSF